MKCLEEIIFTSMINEANEIVQLPEAGTTAYSYHIETLINELNSFKKSLKRGPDRHKHRKEISNLQRAIESLRYFNRKNNKLLDN